MTYNQSLDEVRLLTVADVAKIMSTSKMTIYRLVNNGELPAIRVGRGLRIHEQAVREYLSDAVVEPNA